jgi:hypothetical protein
MNINSLSSLMQFIGACCVGISQQFGFGGGWGGVIIFKSNCWRSLNGIGWLFLVIGFFIEFVII